MARKQKQKSVQSTRLYGISELITVDGLRVGELVKAHCVQVNI